MDIQGLFALLLLSSLLGEGGPLSALFGRRASDQAPSSPPVPSGGAGALVPPPPAASAYTTGQTPAARFVAGTIGSWR